MKKILLASAALIAFGAVAAQAADPIKLELGGYANQWVGYATNKANPNGAANGPANGSYTKVDSMDDVEIDFKGSTKLDNGVSVGVEVDTNGSQGRTVHSTGMNAGGKRSFVSVSGIFGAVEVGEQDNVGALIHNGSPDVGGIGGQDGNWMNWVAAPAGHAEFRQRTYAADDRSANKVIYITPAFYGLQAGFSYTPSINTSTVGHTTISTASGDTASTCTSGIGANITGGPVYNVAGQNNVCLNGDLYVYGLAYAKDFGKIGVKADVGSGKANVAGLTVYQGGTQIAYALTPSQTITVGGSGLQRQVNSSSIVSTPLGAINGAIAAGKGLSWDAGASFTTGPYGVSLTYFSGEALNGLAGSVSPGTQTGYDKDQAVTLAGAYTMGPGIQLTESVFHVNYDAAFSNTANENAGWGAVTGVALKF